MIGGMTESQALRAVVVGAGRMGSLYAEQIARSRNAGFFKLMGVVDPLRRRADELALRYGVASHSCLQDALRNADVAIIATPPVTHSRLALMAIHAGLDVLVEKPLATRLKDAEEMVADASSRGKVLHVGHQEWWNPAVRAVMPHINEVVRIDAERVGDNRERGLDDSVVVDLMIHDIHIVQSLLEEEPQEVTATGRRVFSQCVDDARAKLVFSKGRVATFRASRASKSKSRLCRIETPNAMIYADLLQRNATRRERLAEGGCSLAFETLPQPEGQDENDLHRQLRRFYEHIRQRESTGIDAAVSALRTALRVSNAIDQQTLD